MAYIERPDWLLRVGAGCQPELIAGSDYEEINRDVEKANEAYLQRMWGNVCEINVSPVLLTDAVYRNSYGAVQGKFVLNGAAGDRLRTRFDDSNRQDWQQKRLQSFLLRTRRRNGGLTDSAAPNRKQPVAIEMKNGHNFFHFLTETLGNLALFLDDRSTQPINLHVPNENVKGFIPAFIEALFPELAPRIALVHRQQKYKSVRAPYNHRHYLYLAEDPQIAQDLSGDDVDPHWLKIGASIRSLKDVRMNSFDASQRLLRQVGIFRAGQDASATPMPRRVYVDRAEGQDARSRGIKGDDVLLEALEARGFERVYFEKLTPLDQIRVMQSAEILISPHGAGLANMIFARSDALCIEIGTRQTQLHRWGDFLPCAHVSQCRYATVFADVLADDPRDVPSIKDGHIGIHVGQRALDEILALVDAYPAEAGSSPRNS